MTNHLIFSRPILFFTIYFDKSIFNYSIYPYKAYPNPAKSCHRERSEAISTLSRRLPQSVRPRSDCQFSIFSAYRWVWSIIKKVYKAIELQKNAEKKKDIHGEKKRSDTKKEGDRIRVALQKVWIMLSCKSRFVWWQLCFASFYYLQISVCW